MDFRTAVPAAKYLGIPEYMLRRMIKNGECIGVYSGSRFYVDVERMRQKLALASEQNARF